MIHLNDAAIEYMNMLGFRDIVLLAGDGRTWCDASKAEVSVSFTDEDPEAFAQGYLHEASPIGAVYIPEHSVELGADPCIRYERHPWIERFELDDIRPSATCCIWVPPT